MKMKQFLSKRVLSLLLVFAMVLSIAAPVGAVEQSNLQSLRFEKLEGASATPDEHRLVEDQESEQPQYGPDETVRVSIVLEGKSTVDAGFSTMGIAQNSDAMAYREDLKAVQKSMTAKIEGVLGTELKVHWNLTLAANIISADVPYGKIDSIRALPGVADVVLETRYEPCVVQEDKTVDPSMATSGSQIGSAAVWANGYTGAGQRVAIIDTGLDMDHQSFDAGAFDYALSLQETAADLLTVEEIAGVLSQLNAAAEGFSADAKAEDFYFSTKVPFGYNYVDAMTGYIDHDRDSMGGHGSHVAGISAANRFLPTEEGYVDALTQVGVQGVAPDAQVFVMKVFGINGGAYDSDYFAAIEDAIVLGADAVNLSLGSGAPGSTTTESVYEEILASLSETDTLVAISAGNNGHWADSAFHNAPGYLYAEDVSTWTGGSPGSFTNSLAVASVDNAGGFGYYFTVGETNVMYTETDYENEPLATLAGEQEYIFTDGIGDYMELIPLDGILTDKVFFCYRGEISFYEKAVNAVDFGAIATVVCNNQPGSINMDLTDYYYTNPCVSITQAEAEAIRAASTPVTDEEGNILYYTGTMTIHAEAGTVLQEQDYYTMSSFSSWGVPGDLSMKPEITAPGGDIYSLDGEIDGGKSYVNMSGTSMAAPQITGMAALVAQYIEAEGLAEKTGLSHRVLMQSLLMSTAVPMEQAEGGFYPVLRQGAGLANVSHAIDANSYILMQDNATDAAADGKVKAELGDDPEKLGVYEFGFTLYNLTDADGSYLLSSHLFTQNLASDGTHLYMNTTTAVLGHTAQWTVNGEIIEAAEDVTGYDFNGDGVVSSGDVQALLDHATLEREITNANLADLDADGDVDSHDAYQLAKQLSTGLVHLPAGGSAEICVKLTLSENDLEALDYYFTNGTYVQGYVWAQELPTAEGVLGTCHSIPVLGFYGDWSDASMLDVGRYETAATGEETKAPYLGNPYANYFVITYGDQPDSAYYFGGNPMITDSKYLPERNAIRSQDRISGLGFTAIRDAAQSRLIITNETSGEVLLEKSLGEVGTAYYYPNKQEWRNASYTLSLDVDGASVAEGEALKLSLELATEYDVDSEGNVDWDALGNGASFSTTMVLDDTAPEIEGIMLDLMTNELVITASDNQYVSAVLLTNKGGTRTLAYTGSNEALSAGESAQYRLDASGIKGNSFLVQVYDYAMNLSTYLVEMTIGTPENYTGRMFGFTSTEMRGEGKRWVEIIPGELYYDDMADVPVGGGMIDVGTSDQEVCAAEYADGYVFFATYAGEIFAAEQGEWDAYQKVCDYFSQTNGVSILDMAYHYGNGLLYVLTDDNTIYTLDTLTGDMEVAFTITITNPWSSMSTYLKLRELAIDGDGNFYSVNHASSGTYLYLYKWTLDDVVDGAITDLAPLNNTQDGYLVESYMFMNVSVGSLVWDPIQDILYLGTNYSSSWTHQYNRLVQVDMETGKASNVNEALNGLYYDHVVGLYIVPATSNQLPDSDAATSVTLNREELNVMAGSTFDLTADVYPWNLADKSVTWTSSDETVATVRNGRVNAIAPGIATITVASNATPEIMAQCVVTVEAVPNVELNALIYNADSVPTWSEFTTDGLPAFTEVAEGGTYVGGTLHEGMLYAHDGSNLYAIDPDTFETTNYGGLDAQLLWSDAATAPKDEAGCFGYLLGLCNSGTWLEMVDMEAFTVGYYRIGGYLNYPAAAIAYAGNEPYDYYGTMCPAVHYYILDEGGYLYTVTLLTTNGGESYSMSIDLVGYTGIRLSGVSSITKGTYASMEYDEESGLLVLASYQSGEYCNFYAIDPNDPLMIPASLGTLPEKVWPAVSLYQYDRATDLTLRLTTTEGSIYVGDTFQLAARTILGETNAMIYASSDETVATVDSNGLVTALGVGEVTITVTTVDVNDNGEHLSAQCVITVKDLVSLDATVNAQIQVSGESKFVTIDLSDKTFTVNGASEVTLTAGGWAQDAIFGSDVDLSAEYSDGNFYKVDPETFEATQGGFCDSSFAPLAIADAPATTFNYTYYVTDWDTWEETEYLAENNPAFGFPMFLSKDGMVGMLTDFDNGDGTIWYLDAADLGALTYLWSEESPYGEEMWGDYYYGGCDAGTAIHYYAALGADGTLYLLSAAPCYTLDYETYETYGVDYQLGYGELGNIGMTFDSNLNLSMVCTGDGLLISDSNSDTAQMYYVDLNDAALAAQKVGSIEGVSGINTLYQPQAKEVSEALSEALAQVERTAVSVTASDATAKKALFSSIVEYTDVMAQERAAAPEAVQTEEVSAVVTAPLSAAEPSEDETAVTVDITAKELSYNGVVNVSWDADALELQDVVIHGDFVSKSELENALRFGYVCVDGIAAESPIATLVFHAKTTEVSQITIQHEQLNNGAQADESVDVEFSHEHTEVRDAREATCTEDGYTGDTYCANCGKLLKKGEVIPAACPTAHFDDVPVGTWYHDDVDYVVELGLIQGMTPEHFGPEIVTNRAMMAQLLYRMAGSPSVEGLDHPFTDVRAEQWFHDAVVWAYHAGVIKGVSAAIFAPAQELSRDQMVTMLYRYAGAPDADLSVLEHYSDGNAVMPFAQKAFAWAISEEIVTGMGNGMLCPTAVSNRAQLATILTRYLK